MNVPDHAGLLRTREGGDQPVAPFELFFDLVFVFEEASTKKTRIERDFDPEAVRRMKGSSERDMSVSGPELATHAFEAGLVDECHLFLAPIVIGGGKWALPERVRVGLELLDERRFGNGMVYLLYRTKG